MPKEKREPIKRGDEIFGFLKQSHLSEKNVLRLKALAESGDREIATIAAIVLEVAEVTPYKRRRLKILAQIRKDLLQKLNATRLIYAHHG